jgi:hypothetical protein
VSQGLRDRQDQQVHKELLVLSAQLVLKVLKEFKVLPDQQEQTELQFSTESPIPWREQE